MLTFGVYLPSALYPGYRQAFQVDDLTMTLIYAVFALVSAPALLLLGPVSDTWGARPVLLAGVALAALGSGCFALAPNVTWLIIGRAAQGLALGAATGAAAVLVNESGDGRRRGAVLAGIAFVAGTASGAVLGGLLAQYAPAPYVLPFLLHLLLLGIGCCRVMLLTRSDVAAHQPRWRLSVPRIPTGMRAVFAAAAAVGFLAWTAAGLFLAIIPALLERAGHSNMAVTGGILGAVLVFSALTQPLVTRVDPHRAQLAGLAALLVSFTALALTAGRSVPATLAAAVVAGVGNGLAYAGAAAAIDARAPEAERGAITGALYLAFYLGSGLPAVAVGLLTLRMPLASATSLVTSAAATLVLLAGVAAPLAYRGSARRSEVILRSRSVRDLSG